MLNVSSQTGYRPIMVDQYPELYRNFRWHVPMTFNLATACCLKWAELPSHERRQALVWMGPGAEQSITFGQLAREMSQLANGLSRLGVIPGDRVVILLTQPGDLLIAMMACWAIRAVAVPLVPNTAPDTLLTQLKHARSQVALIDSHTQDQALTAIARCPRIKHVVGKEVYDGRVMNWRGLTARQPQTCVSVGHLPSDPAVLVWPEPIGADLPENAAMLLAHQGLIGQLPGFVAVTNWFPDAGNDMLCTLPLWSETGLMGAVLPALYFGHTVRLASHVPAPAHLPSAISHIVTTTTSLIQCLKHSTKPNSHIHSSIKIAGLTVLGKPMIEGWRTRALDAFGVEPNVGCFVSGCGLILGQSATRWPNSTSEDLRVMPGHRVRFSPQVKQGESAAPSDLLKLEIARTDATGHTDPALFIQLWPARDSLDLGVTLPEWWPCGLTGQTNHPPDDSQQDLPPSLVVIEPQRTLERVEQHLLELKEIGWCQVFYAPSKKASMPKLELWVLIETRESSTADDELDHEELRKRVNDVVLQCLRGTSPQPIMRLGLVDGLPRHTLGQADRSDWSARQQQALIQFI